MSPKGLQVWKNPIYLRYNSWSFHKQPKFIYDSILIILIVFFEVRIWTATFEEWSKLVKYNKSLKMPKWSSKFVYRRLQTTQWPKEKVQRDKQPSTKHTHKTKDRVTRIPLKTRGELMCYGRVSSSCFTSGTRHVNLVTNVILPFNSINPLPTFYWILEAMVRLLTNMLSRLEAALDRIANLLNSLFN